MEYGGGWEYTECELCHRTYVSPSHTDAHFNRFHAGASGEEPAVVPNGVFDSPPPPSDEERMVRVLTDSEIWG